MMKLHLGYLPRILERNQLKKNTIIAIFFKSKLKQIQDLKWQVQEPMFEYETEVEEISKSGCQLEVRLEEFV